MPHKFKPGDVLFAKPDWEIYTVVKCVPNYYHIRVEKGSLIHDFNQKFVEKYYNLATKAQILLYKE